MVVGLEHPQEESTGDQNGEGQEHRHQLRDHPNVQDHITLSSHHNQHGEPDHLPLEQHPHLPDEPYWSDPHPHAPPNRAVHIMSGQRRDGTGPTPRGDLLL